MNTYLTVTRSRLLDSARTVAGVLRFPDVAESPVRPPRAPMPTEPLLVFATTLQLHVCSILFFFFFVRATNDRLLVACVRGVLCLRDERTHESIPIACEAAGYMLYRAVALRVGYRCPVRGVP